MSWIRRDAFFREPDESLFCFKPSKSIKFETTRPPPEEAPGAPLRTEDKHRNGSKRTLNTASEWFEILEDIPLQRSRNVSPGANVILAGRTPALATLPFTKEVFSEISKKWSVHSSIARVINRNKSCHFGRIPYQWDDKTKNECSIVYNCRTSDTWEKDMALSVTYFPQSMVTNAVWYGCGLNAENRFGQILSDADIITGRMTNFDGPVLHPMLLPTIFAEFERDRLIGLSRDNTTELVRRLHSLADLEVTSSHPESEPVHNPQQSEKAPTRYLSKALTLVSLKSVDSQSSHGTRRTGEQTSNESRTEGSTSTSKAESNKDVPTVVLWLRVSELRNGIENWRNQLLKMMEHAKELEDTNYQMGQPINISSEHHISALRVSGDRVMGRLKELLSDCDEATRDCARAMEGMSLANQLETNIIGRSDSMVNQKISESSLHLAKTARRDSEIMKPIAVLGMIFLPGMFTSSFFSIGFFEYREDKHMSAEQYVWIWACITVLATVLTILIFQCSTARRLKRVAALKDEDLV